MLWPTKLELSQPEIYATLRFIIERKGKPLAAVVPVERLEQMRRAARMHLLQVIERQEGKPSPAEADRLANEAKHRTRKPRRR